MAPALFAGIHIDRWRRIGDLNFLLLDFDGHRDVQAQRLVGGITTLSFS